MKKEYKIYIIVITIVLILGLVFLLINNIFNSQEIEGDEEGVFFQLMSKDSNEPSPPEDEDCDELNCPTKEAP